jgi:hypothetical protein
MKPYGGVDMSHQCIPNLATTGQWVASLNPPAASSYINIGWDDATGVLFCPRRPLELSEWSEVLSYTTPQPSSFKTFPNCKLGEVGPGHSGTFVHFPLYVVSKSVELKFLCPVPFFSYVEWGWDWVHLVCRPLIGLLYQPRMIVECEAVGGMRIGRGNRNTTLSTTNILTWDRTPVAWTMARP